MMATFAPGDYVKAEFKSDSAGENEWMWVKVELCDEQNQLVFGWLDSQPLLDHGKLKLGSRLAVSFDSIREHKKASEFTLH